MTPAPSASEFWFVCPDCRTLGSIDQEQADMQVSIQCPTDGCKYHETEVVRPLVPCQEAVNAEVLFLKQQSFRWAQHKPMQYRREHGEDV